MSIFIGLSAQPGREAKENIIFFVAQCSTTLSAGLAEGPYVAFGASQPLDAHLGHSE